MKSLLGPQAIEDEYIE